jgi:hypothetical protein
VAVRQTELLCHELLLKLAGRLPDRHLWRYRDWLAGEAAGVVARVLPSTLVSERITITDDEHQLMSDALLPLGGDPAVINAVLPSDGTVTNYKFSAESPVDSRGDTEALVLGATLRGRPGVGEVRCSWRRVGDGEPRRIVLVTASAEFVALTGEIQRVLRALGEAEPRVEVLPPDVELPAYHRDALEESALVCTGAEELAGHRSGGGHP